MTELIFLRWISLFTSSSLSCAPSPERIIERLKAEGQMIFAEERLYPRHHHQPAVLFTHKRDVLAPSTIFSTSLMGRKTPEMRLSPNRKWSPDDSMWRKIAHQIPSTLTNTGGWIWWFFKHHVLQVMILPKCQHLLAISKNGHINGWSVGRWSGVICKSPRFLAV